MSDSTASGKTKRKVALITGITGQDGSYLTEFLLAKGYEVNGHVHAMKLHYGDLNDSSSLVKIISAVKPNEIYNLGAQSHVKISFDLSEYTADVDAVGTLRILDAIRTCGLEKEVRFYQASTSELYGKVQEIPQTETTPFYPRSPYAAAKLYAYWITINYREAYGMYAVNGILFNHESPRRGSNFVTRKITRSVAKIHEKQQRSLELGSLDSKRDWGHAKDYVEAMWLMLQHDTPEDFVIATGETHSVREFVEAAFKEIGQEIVLVIIWEGQGVNEVGKEKATGIVRITVNPKYYRPTEVKGKHELVTTTCGHLYGKCCIRKKLRQTSKCPLCEKTLETTRQKTLRSMCLNSVVTIFPFEIQQLRQERKQLKIKLKYFFNRLERMEKRLSMKKKHIQTINSSIQKYREKQAVKIISKEKSDPKYNCYK
ncbi:unnamed protein product [Didymodactylos carnosus]|uniref:GDP-mannose 4,6-dehydratase n=2 Tax=Didymodactylos carnosus TaxID=1234261 RepID=A0A814VC83_9BILA|nr:unnamed protein product [Didymodactylos carnosus]CAF3947668.1 unnamed protein product [Didymodactylos carnosus]